MVEELGGGELIGKEVIDMFDEKYTIIGIVSDFHFESLFIDIRPLVMVRRNGNATMSVKLNANDFSSALSSITNTWNEFNPNQVFRYSFLDQRFEKMYDELNRAKALFLIFALMSITIACLGLFGLSLHLVEQRGKEISIRKVLGANSWRILVLLNVDFVKLVLLAIALGLPISFYFMEYLLEGMNNRIDLSWYIFAIAGFLALLVAILTTSFESIRAALVNPVDGIRSD